MNGSCRHRGCRTTAGLRPEDGPTGPGEETRPRRAAASPRSPRPAGRRTARRRGASRGPRAPNGESDSGPDASHSSSGIAERHERAAAALDVERGRAAEQDDVRSGDTGRARTRTSRPRQCSAVRLRRVGRREHEHVVVGARALLAQPLDGARQRELGSAEALDEVAADDSRRSSRVLAAHRRPLRTHPRSPSPRTPSLHHDPLPLEQQLRAERADRRRPGRGERSATSALGSRSCRRPAFGRSAAVAGRRPALP